MKTALLLQIVALLLFLSIEDVIATAVPLEDDLEYATTTTGNSTMNIICNDGQESCECPESASSCNFHFRIYDGIDPFTSYQLLYDEKSGDMIIKARTGVSYLLDRHGYKTVNPPSDTSDTSDPLPHCYIKRTPIAPVITEKSFTDRNCTVPLTVDGNNPRHPRCSFIVVNGRIPGPTLVVYEKQILRIRVHNLFGAENPVGTSIHWHGMFQKITDYMDGMGKLSHRDIPTNTYFDYVFKADPSGTHWYHSHVGAQRGDGMFGALIVKEKTPPSQYNEVIDMPSKHTISIIEWSAVSAKTLTRAYLMSNSTSLPPSQKESVLLNGRGQYDLRTFTKLNIITVDKGKQYRFRLIGANVDMPLRFSIQSHRLSIIAIDGFYIENNNTVDYIIIHGGERYDFILNTDQKLKNYRIIVINNNDLTRYNSFAGILRYNSALIKPSYPHMYKNVINRARECSAYSKCVAINCPVPSYPQEYIDCLRLDKINALFNTDRLPEVLGPNDPNLKFFDFGFTGLNFGSINSVSHVNPTIPYATNCDQFNNDKSSGKICLTGKANSCVHAVQIAQESDFSNGNHSWPSVNFVFSVMTNDVYHPIHMHGHSYHIIEIGYGKYNKTSGDREKKTPNIDCTDTICSAPHWTNNTRPASVKIRAKPIRKDTIIVPSGGYVVIGFIADNPGYWFMHCHIERHQIEGMAIIVQEYDSGQQWLAPPGINSQDNFRFTLDDYRYAVKTKKTCLPREKK